MLFAARDSRDMDRVWLMHVVGLDMTGVCERSVYGMFVQWEVDMLYPSSLMKYLMFVPINVHPFAPPRLNFKS